MPNGHYSFVGVVILCAYRAAGLLIPCRRRPRLVACGTSKSTSRTWPSVLGCSRRRAGEIASRNLRRAAHWSVIAPELRLCDVLHVAVPGWARAGVPLAAVRTWVGHSSLSVTSRYTHVAGSEDAAALALINGRAGDTRGSQEPVGSLEKAR